MSEGVIVKQSFLNAVRTMLIGMSAEGVLPPKQIAQQIDKSRQFCEGYLGIDRDALKSMNPAEVAEVLKVCGLPLMD